MSNGSEPLAAQSQSPPPKTWGYFATFGWVLLAYVVASIAAFAALYLWDPAAIRSDLDFSGLMKDARHFSQSTIVTNAFLVAFLIWAAWLPGKRAKEYLALNWAPRQEVVVALVSLAVLLPLLDVMAYLAGQPIIPPFMVDIYGNAKTTDMLPLLWLAVVVAAPVAEEVVFRGFIFRGWVQPSQRPMVGILLVTTLFAVIHIQYNWFGILQVFLIGFLLTWTRWRSGSMLLPMLLHFITNFYAMLQVIFYIDWMS
jgi:uncharacterized protein